MKWKRDNYVIYYLLITSLESFSYNYLMSSLMIWLRQKQFWLPSTQGRTITPRRRLRGEITTCRLSKVRNVTITPFEQFPVRSSTILVNFCMTIHMLTIYVNHDYNSCECWLGQTSTELSLRGGHTALPFVLSDIQINMIMTFYRSLGYINATLKSITHFSSSAFTQLR